jgi:hypothetical protein
MAGDWIKMRVDLATDPDVIGIASKTELDEDTVVGKLHRLWSWADQQTTNGDAASVTEAWIDRFLGAPGFASAMVSAGWLTITSGGVILPDFEKHNGQTGKRRALTARRNTKYRDAHTVTKSAPREDKREDTTDKGKGSKRPKFTPPTALEVAAYCSERRNGIDAEAFIDYYQGQAWKLSSGQKMSDWKCAVRNWERRQKDRGQGPEEPYA